MADKSRIEWTQRTWSGDVLQGKHVDQGIRWNEAAVGQPFPQIVFPLRAITRDTGGNYIARQRAPASRNGNDVIPSRSNGWAVGALSLELFEQVLTCLERKRLDIALPASRMLPTLMAEALIGRIEASSLGVVMWLASSAGHFFGSQPAKAIATPSESCLSLLASDVKGGSWKYPDTAATPTKRHPAIAAIAIYGERSNWTPVPPLPTPLFALGYACEHRVQVNPEPCSCDFQRTQSTAHVGSITGLFDNCMSESPQQREAA